MLMASTVAQADDGFKPNYADRLTTPVEGSHIAPRLWPSRPRFPLRVVVLNSFYFNNPYFSAIKEGCNAWVGAMKGAKDVGLGLTCEDSDDVCTADVVFLLGTREQCGGFSGFTKEYGPCALIRLSVFDSNHRLVSPKALKRVAMHEFGHALGIWGHSPNPKDIMSLDEDAFDISLADINTLRLAYAGKCRTTDQP